MAYLLPARAEAAAVALVIRRHKSWEYTVFLGVEIPEVLRKLSTTSECLCDPYAESVKLFYGPDPSGSEACVLELRIMISKGKTNSITVERSHSQQHSLLSAWHWTKHKHLYYMSGEFVGSRWLSAVFGEQTGNAGDEEDDGQQRSAPVESKPRKVRYDRARKKRGGGGAWRAFCSTHAKGKWLSRELLHELSLRYHRLTKEEMDFWREVGRFATQQHRGGHTSFERRHR